MTLQVPYLADEAIERDAEALLAQFAHAKGMVIRPPIPIEDIIEKDQKLHIEFDDLHRRFGVARGGSGAEVDIFGAIFLETGKIVIDESLDPEERPSIEGRYRFTLAHEGGHWRLHRRLVQANSGQGSRQPTVVCRSSRAKERVELQANLYASCLVMPRKLVRQAWCQFENDYPRVLRRQDRIVVPGDTEDEMTLIRVFDRMRDDEAARRLAWQFFVSPIAMRIRLERLGLLYREGRPALFF